MTEPAGEAEASTAQVAALEAQITTLRTGLAANRVSGTAVGLLMAQHRLTRDEAFALLVTQSQNTNTKVATLAEELVRTADADVASHRHT